MAKRFKWRFETVEKVKRREKEQRQEALASSRRTLQAEEQILAELLTLRVEQQRLQKQQQEGRLDPQALGRIYAYLENLNEKIEEQQAIVERAHLIEQQKQQALVEAVQEEKVLENLRVKDQQEFRKQERRKEQAQTDETASRRQNPQSPDRGSV